MTSIETSLRRDVTGLLRPRCAQADSGFIELFFDYRNRCIGQRATGRLRRRKRNDVANTFGAGHQHHNAIESECDTAVWRAALLQRTQQETELFFRLVVADPQEFEHYGLHFLAVNTY